MKAYGLAFLLVGLVLTAQVLAADPVDPPNAKFERPEMASSVTDLVPGQVYPTVQMEPLGAYRGYYGTGCAQGCCGADFGPLWATYCQDKHRCYRTQVNGDGCSSCAATPCGHGACTAGSMGCSGSSMGHHRWIGARPVRSVHGYYDYNRDVHASESFEPKEADIGLPPSAAEPVEPEGPKVVHPAPSEADSDKTKARKAKPVQDAAAGRSARRIRYQMPLRPMCW